MLLGHRRHGFRVALAGATALGSVLLGCIDRPAKPITPQTQSGVTAEIHNTSVDKVDLLMMVDNSGSMRDNQTALMRQLGLMITTLVQPPCFSSNNTTAHVCDATNPDDHPLYPPVSDLHVGVVSSDLGTPGSMVPGCADEMLGDDGRLNPIRNGDALRHHEPAMVAPPSFGRPTDCTDPNEFPAFVTFESTPGDTCMPDTTCTGNATTFIHHFQCNAGLYVNGCGLEQQLEAVWRALVFHHPDDSPGNTDPNAGFVRRDALLAIVLLTDEEDGSVRNCQYAGNDACTDALDVFNSGSTAWSHPNLNLRDYLYTPGSAQDPTWSLDRYITPSDPTHGYLSLKPGHPERVLFAAITGVPLTVPTVPDPTQATGTRVDWDALLGAPSATGPDDFIHRDSTTAIDTMTPEGPVSMRQANLDRNCPERTVPSCRREGTHYSATACTTDLQYFAWPARRIVEVARRFDQAPLCNGQPCHNGLVASICSSDYSGAMRAIIEKIQLRIEPGCLPRRLDQTTDAAGTLTVQCSVLESLAAETMLTGACPPGRSDPPGANGLPVLTVTTDSSGAHHRVCAVNQVPISASTAMPVAGADGWFYDAPSNGSTQSSCAQRISFTNAALPLSGSDLRLECIQSITGVDAGAPVGG